MLLVAYSTQEVEVIDVGGGASIMPRISVPGQIVSASFSPDGRLIAVVSARHQSPVGLLQIWDLASSFQVAPVITPLAKPKPPTPITGLVEARSYDGRRVVVTQQRSSAAVNGNSSSSRVDEKSDYVAFDSTTGKELLRIAAHKDDEVDFSNTGSSYRFSPTISPPLNWLIAE